MHGNQDAWSVIRFADCRAAHGGQRVRATRARPRRLPRSNSDF